MEPFEAKFFDGQSLTPYEVRVTLLKNKIQIESLDLQRPLTLHWALKDMEVIVEVHEDTPGKLTCKSMPDARLIIKKVERYQTLCEHIPDKQIRTGHVGFSWPKIGVLALLSGAVITFLIWGIPHFANGVTYLIPQSWDEKLGDYTVHQFLSGKKVCVAEKGSRILQKITDRLDIHDDGPRQYKVFVVNDPMVNAFTVPGDTIIFFKGLIDKTTNPDSIAGVLGHEMGHAIKRHPTQGVVRHFGMYGILYGVFGGQTDIANQLVGLKYSRADEREADDIGLELLNKANISPQGFVDFFTLIATLSGEKESEKLLKYMEYVSTHPISKNRAEKASKAILNQPYQASMTSREFKALQDICSKTVTLRQYQKSKK